MARKNAKNQDRLPGMQNARIEELHEKSILLEAVRTQRMELTKKESDLAEEVIGLMKKYGKVESGYRIDGVETECVPPDGKMKVKVRVEHESEEDQTKPGEVQHVSPQDGADFDESQPGAVQ